MSLEEKLVRYSDDKAKLDILFEKLYQEYAGLIGFVVSRYISDSDQIRDIINETFLKLFENRRNIQNIKYFLVTTAKNLAINEAKRRSRFVSLPDDDNQFLYESNIYSSVEYQLTIKEYKKVLSEKELNIILLHQIDDLTFHDIALRYRSKENTIRTLYNRSVKKLRKEVK